MCGIAGIYAYRDPAPPVDREELHRIREHMVRRGPDGAGTWISDDRRIGLAHRRLAIIDLSESGAQPMAIADGRYRITFNGEIYNYRELRGELEGKGYTFHSQSDTEVLLHLYADRGQEMVHALRGMFAFGIWDEPRQELFLARDPLGIKPLYYADDGATLRFATLVGALLEGGAVDTGEDVTGIAGFYLFGCVPEPFTFNRAVRALPAGSTLFVNRGGMHGPSRYFSVTEEFRKAEAAPSLLSAAAIDEQIRAISSESMRYHMVSDVPVGIFLSAGIDSSVLAALGAEQNRDKLHAITLGFQEYRGTPDDETVLAGRHAKQLGIRHTMRWTERGDFHDQWRNFFAGMDQPSTDGVNSYLVSSAAAESKLKVAISGLGGDELFGGYPSFRDVPRIQRLVPRAPRTGRALRALSAPILGRVTSPKYAGLMEYGSSHAGAYLLRRALYMPWELPRVMGRERAAAALETLRPLERLQETVAGLENERCIVSALELSWYMRNQLLRDADWAGMAHGVEIRVPFVDVAVLRALAPMMAGPHPPTKAQLAKAMASPLSEDIAARRKTGFSVPVRDWLRAELPRVSRERGLRGWARVVGRLKGGRRFLSFVTDAYGGHGGIALYNRDLLQSLCSYPGCTRVVAFPRTMPNAPEPMPAKLAYLKAAAGGKLRYLATAFRVLRGDRSYDLVVCGHINLLPLAWLASKVLQVPLVLFIYGIDAWKPTPSVLANLLASRIQWVVSISEITATKFHAWVPAKTHSLHVLPNAIHAEWYGPGARSRTLLERYGLEGKTVLMTLGRLVSVERYKGFDEALEVLPDLAAALPDVAYLVVGDGTDRARLEEKARALGVADRVVFTGNVPETEKADHYRLADVYVMPSQGEGFGFVLLEAMACGIPVIASTLDGGREAVRDGQLGQLVDPADRDALKRAIFDALRQPRGVVPTGLEHFSFRNFEARAHALFGQVLAQSPHPYGENSPHPFGENSPHLWRRVKTALILGVSGQDGAYLARLLLDKGYAVFGGSRDAQMQSFANLTRLGIRDRVAVESVSLNDFRSVIQTLSKIAPDEVYNLSGQSSVGLSFEQPVETLESIAFGTLNLLEAIRFNGGTTKLYNAGSSECFGDLAAGPADETTPFHPRSPYAVAKAAAFWEVANYREAYDLFACSGILFNHESSLRPERFVTRKVIAAACRIANGTKESLRLGDLGISRDWGWAPEYVEAMWLMLQQEKPDDYVVATGETHRLQDFVEAAFTHLGFDWREHVVSDPKLARPNELRMSRANPAKARARLGWNAGHTMRDVVRLMIEDEGRKA